MHTLGFRFKPWIHDKSIADGPSILEYLKETIDENDLMKDILLDHKVSSANWNKEELIWELKIYNESMEINMTCNFYFYAADTIVIPNHICPTSKTKKILRVKLFIHNFGMIQSIMKIKKLLLLEAVQLQ